MNGNNLKYSSSVECIQHSEENNSSVNSEVASEEVLKHSLKNKNYRHMISNLSTDGSKFSENKHSDEESKKLKAEGSIHWKKKVPEKSNPVHLSRSKRLLETNNLEFLCGENTGYCGGPLELMSEIATEPWPNDVRLFQPYEVEQILLPDNANCLAVKAFLKMCQLPFEVDHRKNAEFMSPNGQVPLIKCGAFVISELEPIVQFVNNKGISLTEDLDNDTKLDMRAYMTLVHNVLSFAELYVTWVDRHTLVEVTYPRNGYPYPWPLNIYQNYKKRSQVLRKLKAHGWYDYTLEEVFGKVEKCCAALSEKLGDNEYFFGNKLSEVDCMLFAHFFTILTTPLPNPASGLADTLHKFDKLLYHCRRVELKVMGTVTNIFKEDIATMYSSNKGLLGQLIETIRQNEDERQKRYVLLDEFKKCTVTVINHLTDSEPMPEVTYVPEAVSEITGDSSKVPCSSEYSDFISVQADEKCQEIAADSNFFKCLEMSADESDWVNVSTSNESEQDLLNNFRLQKFINTTEQENLISSNTIGINTKKSEIYVLDTSLSSADSTSDTVTITGDASSTTHIDNPYMLADSIIEVDDDLLSSSEELFMEEEDDWVTLDAAEEAAIRNYSI